MNHSSKSRSIDRLKSALKRIPDLKQQRRFPPQFEKWHRDTEVAISHTFKDKPEYVEDFTEIKYSLGFAISGMPDSDFQDAYVRGLDRAASFLESMIDEIEEYWENDEQPAPNLSLESSAMEVTNEVFVVHGKDDGAKETVARFLTKLGLEPVVLREQPNQGRTIIEKFEQYAQVGFAIVLLTPDDTGAARDQCGNSQLRARQNVIFELGFFIGKLGRDRTCALRKADVEIPSDYDGVLYITMDDQEAWKLQLVRELKAAGLDVDANRAL